MKLLFILFSLLVTTQENHWLTNFDEAKKTAADKHEMILLNFSGSDWCGPCMRMRREIFQSSAFISFSNDHIVLLNADFPRSKKNKLSKEQEAMNDQLAEKYNPEGKFPFTLLLTAEGKIVKSWEGFPDASPSAFVDQIKSITDSGK
ncbi:MAG: thioredoxin family protein [Bacteroidetes bacterium]|nr:thioredoxin family protein [Bacteroidota bacterium]